MDKRYWVGFNLVKGIGAVRLRALREHFGDLSLAWQAPLDALQAAGLSQKIAERVIQARASVDLDGFMEQIAAQGIQVLTWEDEAYPACLKEIDQPPPILYLRGELTIEDSWAVAVVGTRRVTAYGRQVTEELASYLAQNGVTVVSGLARGVDAIAHQAALKAGGRTLAVMGNGVDRIYPPEHRALAEQILASGALLSDYAPGTPPEGANFPPRNRLISGLSLAVVVVEAGETSGALITAQFAVDQGREVFAVPGNILAPQSKGTNRLIQQGAHPLLSARDVLEALNLTRVSEQRLVRRALPADEVETQVLNVLAREPLHVDEIRNQTGLPIERVSATLVMMELKGMVRQVGGMNYVAVREEQVEYRT
ncbi:MAG: DNA protecting protein DprA [Anaerolineae bacterium CG2_30_58_95]|nr:MAG: DNA protecting protein DprA [Anaerolineae bacterium CG2_30_58_95]PJH75951.1 MAG: DNA-protecting protein DprA [Anaerolineae bacterium CG_4_9_14_0_8_um_filter_58_9]